MRPQVKASVSQRDQKKPETSGKAPTKEDEIFGD